HGRAIVAVVAVPHKRSSPSLTVENRRTALGACQCHDETRSGFRHRYADREPHTGKERHRNEKSRHVHSVKSALFGHSVADCPCAPRRRQGENDRFWHLSEVAACPT